MSNDTTNSEQLTKTCTGCNQPFPATKEYFYASKSGKYGLQSKCKVCIAEQNRRYYEENKEQLSEYREENKEKITERNRRYYEENKERIAEWHRRYYEENKKRIDEYREENKERIAEQKRQYYEDNKEQMIEHSRQYYEDNKEYYAERNRRYYEENKKRHAEWNRRYYEENKERIDERNRQWHKENPDKSRIYRHRRRARKNNLPDTFTSEQWEFCLDYFNFTCPVCDSQLRDLFGEIEPHADHWIPLSYEGDDNPGTVATNMVCLCNKCNQSKHAKLPEDWLSETYSPKKVKSILGDIEAYFELADSLFN